MIAVDIGGTSWVSALIFGLLALGYIAHVITRESDKKKDPPPKRRVKGGT